MRRYRRRLWAAWRVLRGDAVIEANSYTLLWHGATPMAVTSGKITAGGCYGFTFHGPAVSGSHG